MNRIRSEAGFSLAELLVATGILMIISAIVTGALLQMTNSQQTIWNRTEMHSGIRGATELLQQEVGQAGRSAIPGNLVLTAGATATLESEPCDEITPSVHASTVAVAVQDDTGTTITAAMNYGIAPLRNLYAAQAAPWAFELLTTMDGANEETIKLSNIDVAGGTISACFTKDHIAGTKLRPLGTFATGVIPNTGIVNGSSGTVLKLYGDIQGDGNIVYVEYTCDTSTTPGNLYRNVMPFDTAPGSKPALSADKILLGNILPNPGGTPCFSYQTTTMNVQGTPFTFVLDVAITLTVQSELIDPITKQKQTETKALLNVSPRNVFNAWGMASIGYTDRIQSTPANIQALLQ